MELRALRPVAVGAVPWRTSGGAHRLTVIVKATFELRHGQPAVLIDPYPLFSDLHHEDNQGRSLRVASDYAPRKPKCDILFTGSAYAPLGERVSQQKPRIAVAGRSGILMKTLLVEGDRKSTRLNSSHIQKSRMPSSA